MKIFNDCEYCFPIVAELPIFNLIDGKYKSIKNGSAYNIKKNYLVSIVAVSCGNGNTHK